MDSTGRHKTDAEFVNLIDGIVTLEAPDGRIIKLPLERLSVEDRAHALDVANAGKEADPRAPRVDLEAPKDSSGPEVSAVATLRPGAMFRDGKQENYVSLKVKVTALGGIAEDAYAVGPVQVEPLKIDGKAYKAEMGFGESGFNVIDRANEGAFANHPKDGVTVEIDFGKVPDATTKAGLLEGSFQVLTGGTEKIVEIANLLKRSTAKINDPALKAAGISVKFIRDKQGDDIVIGVEFRGDNANAFVALELIDGQGNPVKRSTGSTSFNGVKQYTKYVSEEVLKDAVLKLRFRDGAEKVDIPFRFPEVEVSK